MAMTEIQAINTLSYLLGYEKAVDKGELDGENHLNSQEKAALQFILDEIQQYRAIGTVEEFKALKEKNEPKKPLFSTVHGDIAYHCSSCKKFVGFYDTRIYEYCHNCGQKLDWKGKCE